MRTVRTALLAVPILVAAAGCGSTVGTTGTSPGRTAATSATAPPTTPLNPPALVPSSSARGPETPIPPSADRHARSIIVGSADGQQLVAFWADKHAMPNLGSLTLSDSSTFMGYDRSTGTYWAAAQVLVNDKVVRGPASYTIFEGPTNSEGWDVIDVGSKPGACPVQPPATIAQAWGWGPDSCRPTLK